MNNSSKEMGKRGRGEVSFKIFLIIMMLLKNQTLREQFYFSKILKTIKYLPIGIEIKGLYQKSTRSH